MMVPPQKNIFLLLYCIIFDNKFLLILRNSKLLSINFLCVTLSHMSIAAGVILSIALQQVDAAPDTQGTAQTDHDRLQSIDCTVEKFHKVLTFCRLFCGTPNCFFKKCRLIRRLHLHPTGRFRTGQNFRPVRLPAAVSGADWIRTCPHQRYSFCPHLQGTCSAGAL